MDDQNSDSKRGSFHSHLSLSQIIVMYFSLKLFWQQVGPTCKTNYSFQNSIKRTKSSIVSELRIVLFRRFEYIYIYIWWSLKCVLSSFVFDILFYEENIYTLWMLVRRFYIYICLDL